MYTAVKLRNAHNEGRGRIKLQCLKVGVFLKRSETINPNDVKEKRKTFILKARTFFFLSFYQSFLLSSGFSHCIYCMHSLPCSKGTSLCCLSV